MAMSETPVLAGRSDPGLQFMNTVLATLERNFLAKSYALEPLNYRTFFVLTTEGRMSPAAIALDLFHQINAVGEPVAFAQLPLPPGGMDYELKGETGIRVRGIKRYDVGPDTFMWRITVGVRFKEASVASTLTWMAVVNAMQEFEQRTGTKPTKVSLRKADHDVLLVAVMRMGTGVGSDFMPSRSAKWHMDETVPAGTVRVE